MAQKIPQLLWKAPYQTGFCSNGENVWLNSLSGRTQNQGRSWFLSSNNHKLRFLFTILQIHIFKFFLNWSREFCQAISQYNLRYLISRSWADFFCYCVYQISKIRLLFAKITESLNWNFCPTFWKWSSSLPFWNLLTTFHTFLGVFFSGFLRKSKYIEHSFNKYIQNSFVIFKIIFVSKSTLFVDPSFLHAAWLRENHSGGQVSLSLRSILCLISKFVL